MQDKFKKYAYSLWLRPPPKLRAAFARAAEHAPPEADIQPESDLHITVASGLQVPRTYGKDDLMRRIANMNLSGLRIKMTDMDTFDRPPSSANKSRIAWLRPDGLAGFRIQEMNNRIVLSLRAAGYNVGKMDCRPHMTIARQRFDSGNDQGFENLVAQNQNLRMPKWNVNRLYLVRRWDEEEDGPPPDPAQPGATGEGNYKIVATFKLS